MDTHRPREALTRLMRARELARSTGNAGDMGEALLGLGRVRQRAGALAVAQHFFEEAQDWMQKAGMRRGQAEVAFEMGRNEWLGGAFLPALRHLEAALLAIEGRPSQHLRSKIHRLISEIHESRGEHEAALRHFKAFHESEHRISSLESQRRIQALLEGIGEERNRRQAELARQRSEEVSQAMEAATATANNRHPDADMAPPSPEGDAQRQPEREDALTGVLSRTALDAEYGRECERSRASRCPLAVALIEPDRFKSINERHGYRIGAEVLRRLGFLFRQTFRAQDIIGRLGGEVFMVAMVDTPLASAAAHCERLRERVAGHAWSELHPDLQQVTVSIGLAGDAEDPAAVNLVAFASRQLSAAQQRGRNRLSGQPISA
jgi:diguanylate cyclase (GGDEF)-like protein